MITYKIVGDIGTRWMGILESKCSIILALPVGCRDANGNACRHEMAALSWLHTSANASSARRAAGSSAVKEPITTDGNIYT